MSQPLLSIIVPVYKVEDYLCRCLDSILGQTYENFELILVDDGSPDGCGAICDRYAQQDPRVKVIHKENGGVSSARNAGLAQAKGEWIGWVDPDDWVDEDMYAYLMTAVLEEGADVAVCGRIEEYEDHTRERGWEERRVLDREEAMHYLLLNDDMQNLLWDKVWKRFWQADPSRGADKGSGLGLAMVKQIAEAHGGTLSVVSEPGQGSEFTFTMDCCN